MKIGLALPDLETTSGRGGGVAAYARYLAQGLAALGHEVHIFTRRRSGAAPRFSRHVTIHRVGMDARRSSHVRALERLSPELAWSCVLSDYIVRHAGRLRLDVLEGCDISAPLFFLQLRKIADPKCFPAPIVIRLHSLAQKFSGWGPGEPYARGFYALDHAENFSIGAAQGLLATTKFTRDIICRKTGIAKAELPVIALPLAAGDAKLFQAQAKRDPWRGIFAGRLEPRKGPDLLIHAALPWLRRHPRLEIHLLGFDTLTHRKSSMLAHLRRLVPLAYRRRFRFTGPLTLRELKDELGSCGFFALTSRFDNSPYVALEAAAAGCPIIATRTSGLSELFQDGHSALFCSARVAPLSKTIGRLLAMSDAERAKMAEAAQERAAKLCDPRVIAEQQAVLYRNVIRRPRRPRRPRLPPNFPFRDLHVGARGPRPMVEARPRTDNKPSIVSIVRVERLKTAAAKNAAARATKSDYLIFLDAGQSVSGEYLRRAAKALDLNPELGFAWPWPASSQVKNDIRPPWVFEFPLALTESLAPSYSVVRRRAFENAGGLAPASNAARQFDNLWISIGEKGWGGLPLIGAFNRGIRGADCSLEPDSKRSLAGHAALRRRFELQLSRMQAARRRERRNASVDWDKACSALALWKSALHRNYDRR